MNVTAITISRDPVARKLEGLSYHNHAGQLIESANAAQRAWFTSLQGVRSKWAFWLDSDDELSSDYLSVIQECIDTGNPVSYTDELVVKAGVLSYRQSGPYSQQEHFSNPLLLHHLVVFDVQAARVAIERLPVGAYWPEMLLFWSLAKQGASYVPRVGYVWNRSEDGLSSKWFSAVGIMRSQLWCKENP